MNIGTKSVLFGVHQFAIHPWFVALAWWRLYEFPWDPRLWFAFFLHDLGYLGKPNMDGPEGEKHPVPGARLMGALFGEHWYWFTLLHSRYYAKKHGLQFSRLAVADKFAFVLTPWWLRLTLSNLTGEIHEYMHGFGARTPAGSRTQRQWFTDLRRYMRAWVMEHRDGRADTWSGTKRDDARVEVQP